MKALVSTHFGPLPEMHLEERAKPVEKKVLRWLKCMPPPLIHYRIRFVQGLSPWQKLLWC